MYLELWDPRGKVLEPNIKILTCIKGLPENIRNLVKNY